MKILIVCPTRGEYNKFNRALSTYKMMHNDIVNHNYKVVYSGIGKVNAAATVAEELSNASTDPYNVVVVVGYAASSGRFKVGDFVAPKSAVQFDIRFPKGFDNEITEVRSLIGSDDAVILTGDTIVTADDCKVLTAKYGISYLIDGESAAVAQIAGYNYNVPVLVLKKVSNVPSTNSSFEVINEYTENDTDFTQFVQYAESLLNN